MTKSVGAWTTGLSAPAKVVPADSNDKVTPIAPEPTRVNVHDVERILDQVMAAKKSALLKASAQQQAVQGQVAALLTSVRKLTERVDAVRRSRT